MQELFQSLPPAAQNYVRAETPRPMKLMAASGRLPIPAQQLGLVLYLLAHDEDQEIATKATESLQQQPHSILQPALNHPQADPHMLHFFAFHFSHDAKILEAVIMHRQTPGEILAELARQLQEPLLNLLVQNQKKQLEHPIIVTGLLQNPAVSGALRTRVLEFALRQGIDTGYTAQELSRFIPTELLRELLREHNLQIESPSQELDLQFDSEFTEELASDILPAEFLDEGLDEELEGEAEDDKKLTVEQQVMLMSVSEKIVAAKRGNKQIRSILIRDGNKLVCSAVMDNPRLTEAEVMKIAASRSVSEEVIRIVTRNRDWMKLYQVKLNLVNNPKCPTPTALRLLNFLRPNDLRNLATNKNVPSVIATNAKKLAKTRKQG